MGECLQRQRAKRFKHLANKARTELLDAQDLFSQFPEMRRRILNCNFLKDQDGLTVGETVFLVDQGEDRIRVLSDQLLVGYVDTTGSQLLRNSIFSVSSAHSITIAQVYSIAELTDEFTVILDEPSTS